MTEEEFGEFLGAANEELREKQDALKRDYAIGTYQRYWWDQETAKLQFFDAADVLRLEADFLHIGSYAQKSGTWRWAWGNESILPELRQKVEGLKSLEGITGYDLFGQEHAFEIEDEVMAWELAAVAIKHLGAIGCYRSPDSNGGADIFLAITAMRTLQ